MWTPNVEAAWTELYSTVSESMKAGSREGMEYKSGGADVAMAGSSGRSETPNQAVQRTWEAVAKDLQGNGVLFFKGVADCKMFEAEQEPGRCLEVVHVRSPVIPRTRCDTPMLCGAEIIRIDPGVLQLFPFKLEIDVYTSDGLKSHAVKVMEAIGMAVTALDDSSALIPLLKTLGRKHASYGVKDEHCEFLCLD